MRKAYEIAGQDEHREVAVEDGTSLVRPIVTAPKPDAIGARRIYISSAITIPVIVVLTTRYITRVSIDTQLSSN